MPGVNWKETLKHLMLPNKQGKSCLLGHNPGDKVLPLGLKVSMPRLHLSYSALLCPLTFPNNRLLVNNSFSYAFLFQTSSWCPSPSLPHTAIGHLSSPESRSGPCHRTRAKARHLTWKAGYQVEDDIKHQLMSESWTAMVSALLFLHPSFLLLLFVPPFFFPSLLPSSESILKYPWNSSSCSIKI